MIYAAVFSGEGEALTIVCRPAVEGSLGNVTVGQWNRHNGEWRSLSQGSDIVVSAAAVSPDATTVATCGTEVVLWDAERGGKRTIAELSAKVSAIAFSPDGSTLATYATELTLWDVESGEIKETLTGFPGSILAIAFSPDGKTLAACGTALVLWNLAEGGVKLATVGLSEANFAVAFSSDGETMATGGSSITLWDPDEGSRLEVLPGVASTTVLSVSFSPDDRVLAVARLRNPELQHPPRKNGDLMEFWDLDTRKPLEVIRRQEQRGGTNSGREAVGRKRGRKRGHSTFL